MFSLKQSAAFQTHRVHRFINGRPRCSVVCSAEGRGHTMLATAVMSRRAGLLSGAGAALSILAAPESKAFEWIGVDLTRKLIRPDSDSQQALVAMMDAASTLRQVASLAATPMDSDERFHSRALLPGYAKYLRKVETSAPIVAQMVTGDKEASLSEKYGGSNRGVGLTDPVFEALGRVLTISGRTLKEEALESPKLADESYAAIQALLARVPKPELEKAQQYRVARANQVAQKQ